MTSVLPTSTPSFRMSPLMVGSSRLSTDCANWKSSTSTISGQ